MSESLRKIKKVFPVIRARQLKVDAETALLQKIREEKTKIVSDMRNAQQKHMKGVNQLNQLRNGAQQLATGNAQLASGIVQLDDGARQLKSGTTQLKDGSHELATKLGDGAKQVPTWTEQQKEAIADTIGGPGALET